MIPYAVIKTSGRQYRVSPGDSLSVEKLDGNPGDKIQIKDVLMVGGEKLLVGAPLVSGAMIVAVIERQYRGEKVLVFKKKRRHKYRKMRGHRSELTRLFISEINIAGGSFKAETEANVWTEERIAQKKAERLADAQAMHAADDEMAHDHSHDGSDAKKAAPKKMAAKKGGAKKKTAKKKAGAKKSG